MLANKSGGDILSGTAPVQKLPGFRNKRKQEIEYEHDDQRADEKRKIIFLHR